MRTTNILAIILVIIIIIIAYGLSRNSSEKQITTISYNNIDSLQRTIDSLQLEIKVQGDGFDYKELRYEETIFRYELGIEHIKHYHREAYEEFVRISQFKERYDRETEREFKQRNDLKTIKIKEKWN
jgi:hypothetical protein